VVVGRSHLRLRSSRTPASADVWRVLPPPTAPADLGVKWTASPRRHTTAANGRTFPYLPRFPADRPNVRTYSGRLRPGPNGNVPGVPYGSREVTVFPNGSPPGTVSPGTRGSGPGGFFFRGSPF